MDLLNTLSPLTKILITSATIAAPTMLAIKAYFEMRTSQIKLKASILEVSATDAQSANDTADAASFRLFSTWFDKLVLIICVSSVVFGFILFGFGVSSVLVALITIFAFIIWVLFKWLEGLTAVVSAMHHTRRDSERAQQGDDAN